MGEILLMLMSGAFHFIVTEYRIMQKTVMSTKSVVNYFLVILRKEEILTGLYLRDKR